MVRGAIAEEKESKGSGANYQMCNKEQLNRAASLYSYELPLTLRHGTDAVTNLQICHATSAYRQNYNCLFFGVLARLTPLEPLLLVDE